MDFKFEIHNKVTVWQKGIYKIEALNEEEAKQKMIEIFDSGGCYDEEIFIGSDLIYDTIYELTPAENGGKHTEELRYEGYVLKTDLDNL